ncbi:Bug family tripartite tricarboxylate transporter substrate binding protein [Falsiroseomonas sp. CW058]|uniref:Bug family tripartite tricarboxylate transporter substrate binding protein n=1 Tax=Falsiroseomonas sp. CW058 TaxID=3388664 RepID=UPI003D322143
MPTRRAALVLPVLAFAAPSLAQVWPSRPIRLIVPFAPGGTTDVMARLVAERLGPVLGQPVVVENRAGAGATIGAAAVAQAAPDGHVLVMSNSTSHGVSPSVYPQIPYDAVRDFAHVALVATSPSLLVAHNGHRARNLAEFLDLARRAGEIDFAVSGIGSSSHLAGVRLGLALGVRVNAVPYRGSGPALTDTIAGTVPAMLDSLPSAGPHVRSGALRGIAVSGATRSRVFPDLPTFREGGVDVVSAAWFGISAPAATPPAIVARLAAGIRAVLSDPATVARFEELLGAPPPESTPEGYAEFVRAEVAGFAPIVQAAGITP